MKAKNLTQLITISIHSSHIPLSISLGDQIMNFFSISIYKTIYE